MDRLARDEGLFAVGVGLQPALVDALALDAKMQEESTVTPSECKVLILVNAAAGRGLSVKDIANRLAWEKSRVSHLVTRMEKRGLVEKTRHDDDNRASWVTLTPAADEILTGAIRGRDTAAQRYFFDQLNPGDAKALATLSNRVLESLGREAAQLRGPSSPGTAS